MVWLYSFGAQPIDRQYMYRKWVNLPSKPRLKYSDYSTPLAVFKATHRTRRKYRHNNVAVMHGCEEALPFLH